MTYKEMINNIKTILKSTEETSAVHLKHARTIKDLIDKNESVIDDLIKLMKCIFIIDYKDLSPKIGRVIDFLALLIASFRANTQNEDDLTDHPVFIKFFDFLKQCSCCKHEFARYWSCKLLEKIFSRLEDVSNYVFEEMRETMLKRLDDCNAVRYQAVLVLFRLQDSKDLSDPVTKRFHEIIATDLNTKVRQLCLEKICVGKAVLPAILLRTRDVQPSVRLTAFKKLAKCFKFLNKTQKREILKNGLNDTAIQVKDYFTGEMLHVLLENYENNYLKFLESFRVSNTDENIVETEVIAEKTLNIFFEVKSFPELIKFIDINEDKLIEYEKLTWENVIYYRILVQYLRKKPEFEPQLNAIIPDLVVCCKYIQEFYKYAKSNNINFLQIQFTLKQLFLITNGYDIGDALSRDSLKSLSFELLQNAELNIDVTKAIVANIENCIPNTTDFCLFFVEIISNIAYGNIIDYEELAKEQREKYNQISELKAEINSLKDEERALVHEQNYTESQKVKEIIDEKIEALRTLQEAVREDNDIVELKNDTPTILKYLNIAEAFLSSGKITKVNPSIATLKSTLIDPRVENADSEVKAKALKCFALCAVIDENIAKCGIHIFSYRLIAYDEFDEVDIESLIVSIQATADLLLIYGPGLMAQPTEEALSNSLQEEEQKVFYGGTSLSEIVNAFVALVDDNVARVQQVACMALCKLIIFNRVESASLISRLILKWASPATDATIKEFIGNTLNHVPSLPEFPQFMEEVFVKTIETKITAPDHSALVDVNFENLVKFMLVLCQMSPEASKIHENLAVRICNDLFRKKSDKIVTAYTKLLPQLDLIKDGKIIDILLDLIAQLQDILSNSRNLKNISKFVTILEKKKPSNEDL